MKWYKSSWFIRYGLLACLGVFVAAPFGHVIVGSLENPISYLPDNLFTFIARYISLEQYKNILFYDIAYWAAYGNTILLTLPTVLLAIGIGSLVAYGLRIINIKLRVCLITMYAILSTLPAQVLLVPHLVVLSSMFLTGTRLSLILVGCCSPWYVFFLYRLCVRIPDEEIEAARLEGATDWAIFRQIIRPQMRLGTMVFAIVIAADLWGIVEEPLIYIQDQSKYPLSVLFDEMGISISYAGVLVFSLPVLLIFLYGVLEAVRNEERGGV